LSICRFFATKLISVTIVIKPSANLFRQNVRSIRENASRSPEAIKYLWLHAVVSDLYFDRLAARASVNSICLSRSTWCVKSNYLGIFRYLFKHSNCEIWSFICIALQHFNLWAVARAGFDLAKRKKPGLTQNYVARVTETLVMFLQDRIFKIVQQLRYITFCYICHS